MNFTQQIAALEDTRSAKQAQMSEILQRSLDESRSTDAAEAEQFDTIEREIEKLDGDLVRLRKILRIQGATADPVEASPGADKAVSGNHISTLQLKRTPKKLEPGIRFARYVRCLGLGYNMHRDPADICERMYPEDTDMHNLLVRAVVPAANTQNEDWLGNLVSDEGGMFAEFLEWLRPQTILGQFGTGNIPNLRSVPFRVPLLSQTSGGTAYWVGEGKPKPLTQWTAGKTTLEPRKVAALAVATMELLRDSRPSADSLIRQELADAVRERLDIDFIDPGKAAVANVSPASILNGINAIPSAGSDAEDVRQDLRALMAAFTAAHNPPRQGVWIMGANTAMALSLMQNPLGQTEFPGVNMGGGLLFGYPAIVSDYAVRDTEGSVVALINASQIWLADEGGIDVRASDQASIEMDDAPTNASATTPVETTMVSMFQTNSVAFLAERTINWARARESAVQYLTGVTWGEAS